MPSLRNDATRGAIIQRLQRLTPDACPRWGKLDAPRMLCHLNDALSQSVGDTTARSVNRRALQHFPLKHLVFYVVPFPKNAPTATEFLSTPPGDFDADRRRLMGLINRLATTPRAKGPEHPFFGPLSNDEWNTLQCKHISHHLKQFGC